MSKVDKGDGDIAQLEECLPGMQNPWLLLPALHKPGVMAHAFNPRHLDHILLPSHPWRAQGQPGLGHKLHMSPPGFSVRVSKDSGALTWHV